jgi:hypothetical protein
MDYTPPDRSAAAAAHHLDGAVAANDSPSTPAATASSLAGLAAQPLVTWVEWDHLRYRVVALENLLVALLAEGSASRLDRLREMSRHVAPRRGCTDHPVTLLAAAQIVHLVERARHVKKHPAP